MPGSTNPSLNTSQTMNGSVPQSSRTYYFSMSLALGTPQKIDLRPSQNQNQFKTAQGAFLDNSLNATNVTILFDSGYTLICPAYSQMTIPIYISPSSPVMTVSGNGTVNMTLLNFPTPACVWSTQSPLPVLGGYGQVQDTTVAGLLTSTVGGSLTPILSPSASDLTSGVYKTTVPLMTDGYSIAFGMTLQGVLKIAQGGQSSALNISASTNLKATPGRVGKVIVQVAPTATAYVIDSVGTAQTAANTILTIPSGTVAGTVYNLDFPANVGISVIPSGGNLAVCFD